MTSTANPRHVAVDELEHRDGATLADVLTTRARTHADKQALRFLDYTVERAGVARTLTFAELDRRVTAVAATLAASAGRGDRVAILAPQGPEFVVGFLGALRAGLVAVPLFSPDLPGHGDRLTAVLADCTPTVAVATTANADLVRATVGDVTTIAVDAVPDTAGASWTPPPVERDDLAYLQYTSGSTRLPAGVQITHANVVNNAAQALVAGRADESCTLVSWLPLFHDMGLVFVVGGSLVGAMTAVLMDPIAFLMRPYRWLEQLSANPGSFTAAPNFAFDFCAKRIKDDERAQLDLSGVLIMFNGAEPVSLATLSRFYDTFEPHGLRRGVIAPSYGLAEATVYVTSEIAPDLPQAESFDLDALSHGHASPAHDDAASAQLVACGSDLGDAVVIADPATGARRADGEVGEIWVRSASVGTGYWAKPEQTAEVFDQLLLEAGDQPASGWLRTGDLGVVVGDRLYVTGRIKDVLIVDGRNHYPHDIERTVEDAHPVIGRHRTAAFSVDTEQGEAAVVVAEVSRHQIDGDWTEAEVRKALTRAVSRDHGVTLLDVVLIAPDTVPRTTSGKIARAAGRTAYRDGSLTPARQA